MDHKEIGSPRFEQTIILMHKESSKPVVIETEGYYGRNRVSELVPILDANYINVEHRYFGESSPDSSIINWEFMNIEQAANDHHRIITFFKKFYGGRWVSTGISKGGQTSIFHRYFFPDDVDATVPYVAPVTFGKADKRIWGHLETVSSKECRERVFEFQKEVLSRRDSMEILMQEQAEDDSLSFSLSIGEALEYVVLEYSFAYWQWSDGNCELIPDKSSNCRQLFDHLNEISGISFFSDRDIEYYKPFTYQAFTEIGFYDYDINPFGDMIRYSDGSTDVLYHGKINREYDLDKMKEVNSFIENSGENFIFIYGEYDPWSAPQVNLTGKTSSVKIIHPGGSHRTRINTLRSEDKAIIFDKLEEWLDLEVNRELN